MRPKIAIIIGSTRKVRFADKPAAWMRKQILARNAFDVEILDVRDFALPFFDEAASSLHMPSTSKEAVAWQNALRPFDGFVFVVAEYNHSITAALKNALDQAYKEWMHKPFTAVGYGGVGAARALEHLRCICAELHMVSTRSAVHIGGADFVAVHPAFGKKEIESIEANLLPSCNMALDELSWWCKATMAARALDS